VVLKSFVKLRGGEFQTVTGISTVEHSPGCGDAK